jgi:hypothetical protein
MANTIQHKRSNTPSSIPGSSSLSYGELAINYTDGKVYTKNNSNNIINLAASSISGVNIDPGLINTNSGVVINTGGGTARLYASLGGEIDNSDIYIETDSDAPLHVAYKESTTHVGTTAITLNRSSAAQTLSGVSIDGNAGTVTNGVYITGAQSISGVKTFKDRVISDSGPFIIFGTRQNEGNIHLSNTTCNYISFNASGVGTPDGFTRSLGTKIILSPSPGTSSSDMGIGTESNALWFAVPNATYSTKWYSSSVNTATLTGSGVFTVAGSTSQINVDNLRLDGATISRTNAGHVNISPSLYSNNAYFGEINAGGGEAGSSYGALYVYDDVDSVMFEVSLGGVYSNLPLAVNSYISFLPVPSGQTSLTTNGELQFERVSNTQLKILMRGTDGTTRSTTLTLS